MAAGFKPLLMELLERRRGLVKSTKGVSRVHRKVWQVQVKEKPVVRTSEREGIGYRFDLIVVRLLD